MIITQHSGSDDFLYLHKDTQGSVAMVTNQSRTIITQALYDPFGKQTVLYQHSSFNNITYQAPTEKGYTGHQQLNSVGIIHMGGRIYDASIGRFMQADPFIQAPNNTQSYNRYSYVLNNPMSYTDPSGFNFLKDIGDAFGGFIEGVFTSLASVPIINTAVQVGVGLICGPAAPYCLGAYNTLQTYALTGNLGASLRAGLVSYAGANVGGSEWFQGLSDFCQATVQVGINRLGQTPEESNNQAAYVTQMQTVARTSSNLTGNKFANGAHTRSFFDNFGRHLPRLPQGLVDFSAGFGDSLSFGLTNWFRGKTGLNNAVDSDSNIYQGGEVVGLVWGLSFGGATLGRHAYANGAKAIYAESRTFGTVSRRLHRAFPQTGMQLDHMFFSQKLGKRLGLGNWINSGLNIVPLSARTNSLLLNPNNFYWTKRHTIMGSFVPQSARLGAQSATLGMWGATPTYLYNNY